MADKTALILPDEAYLAKCETLKEDIRRKYAEISHTNTPRFDDAGRKIVDARPDGYEYIIDAYMTDRLNFHFPGWSWRKAGEWKIVGTDWVVVEGELIIIDEKLLAFGVIPPFRYYYGINAHRIGFKKESPHTLENIVDLGNDVVAANTEAKKVAINRLIGIGDDIYRKRIEGEGVDTLDEVIEITGGTSKMFDSWLKEKKLGWPKVLSIKGVREAIDANDFKKAIELINNAKI